VTLGAGTLSCGSDRIGQVALLDEFPNDCPAPRGFSLHGLLDPADDGTGGAQMNVVKCPGCSAEVDLGPNGQDLTDTRYKLSCPVLHVHLVARSLDTDLECPHMGPAKRVAVLQNRRR
jgi:hypothetical protein